MRVLICGSRGWQDPFPIDTLLAGLDVLAEGRSEPLIVIHGDAPGADRLAGRMAVKWGARVIKEPAQWHVHGRGAGPIRNQKMLDEHQPDVVFAFRSAGKSNGTDDMVNRSKRAKVPTYVITREDSDDD